jgi:hypothetical protein
MGRTIKFFKTTTFILWKNGKINLIVEQPRKLISVGRVKMPRRRRRRVRNEKSRRAFKYDISDLSERLPVIMNIRPKLGKMLIGKQVVQKFRLTEINI